MKQIFLLIFSILTVQLQAQSHEDGIIVDYRNRFISLMGVECDNACRLIAVADRSKFYCPETEYVDSLEATPEGKSALLALRQSAMKSGNWEGVPMGKGTTYVFKDLDKGIYNVYDKSGLDYYRYEDPIEDFAWELTDSVKTIFGYECTMARTDFHGRRWSAWFAPEIPVPDGPWKFCGLPGLILEAYDAAKEYSFIVEGLISGSKELKLPVNSGKYENIGRKEYLKTDRAFWDSIIKGTFNADVTKKVVVIGMPADKKLPEIDFMETDYR